ncbi:MAG: orotate phosphoribosyltransferase [Cytophagales bacterium]|nr:orotate phosphoribosyltransferase [Cytophagales bacterium]
MNKEQVAREVAQRLLKIRAIKFSPEKPFTWSSGWKSPIYCDNRVSLSFPDTRTYIKQSLVELVRLHYPAAEVIAGVATAGIPQGALVAEALGLPFAYVRAKPKDHGMENLIEGTIMAGQKVVVIEDLISTGGSSIKAAEALREAEAEVLGMAAIFTYGFPLAEYNFRNADLRLETLCDYSTLLTVAHGQSYIRPDQLELLTRWREKPEEWSA